MSWFIIWCLLSVAVAVFAHNRGRSGGGWFLLSLIISPLLGLLFVAISKDLRKEQQAQASTPGPTTHRRCPACAEWVLPQASVCKHCQGALQPDQQFQANVATKQAADHALDIKTRRIYIGIIVGIVALLFLVKAVVTSSG
jgi:hypothetical protein